MKTQKDKALETKALEGETCPRCDYQLVPVFAIERGVRRPIALTCPEPYCDHMQMITRKEARRIERETRGSEGSELRRAAQ